MNKRLLEDVKLMTSALPQAFTGATTTVNGRGVKLDNARKVAFRYQVGAVASTDTDYTLSVLEATDAATAGARNIGNAVATPTVTLARVADGCIANANIVQLTLVTVAAADVVTINGVTFTAVAGDTVLATNSFDQRGDDTADAVELVSCINNALPNLVATNAAGVITIQSRNPGQETITVTDINDITNIVPVTVEVTGIIEVDASALSDGYDHVFPRAVTSATSAAAVLHITAITGNDRYTVTQQSSGNAFAPNN
jgi:hypothetical protein